MDMVLQTHGLTKRFGAHAAVDQVNMTIRRGDIYGFIGKNGAGKTTLMRMILSLALPSEGSYELFGQAPSPALQARIGSLVETPGFYKNCSARENLIRFSILYGAERKQVEDILQLVGLEKTGNLKAGKFSLGMKQRLGIGIALLKDPEFVVLDEPVNGLDPAGISQIRNLIMELNQKRGVTFLISSHLLDELSKIASHYGIINNGRLVEELSRSALSEKGGSRLRLVVSDAEKARAILQPLMEPGELMIQDHALIVRRSAEESARLNRLLLEGGVDVSSIQPEQGDLEAFFMERIGG